MVSSIRNKIRFPECPAVRQAGLDPTKDYSISELIKESRNNQKLALELEGDRLSKIILYRKSSALQLGRMNKYTKG